MKSIIFRQFLEFIRNGTKQRKTHHFWVYSGLTSAFVDAGFPWQPAPPAARHGNREANGRLTRTSTGPNDHPQCAICLAEPSPKTGPGSRGVVATPCGHMFCRTCLQMSLKAKTPHRQCPVCREEYGEGFIVQLAGWKAGKQGFMVRSTITTAVDALVNTPFRLIGISAMVHMSRFSQFKPDALSLRAIASSGTSVVSQQRFGAFLTGSDFKLKCDKCSWIRRALPRRTSMGAV